MNTRAHSRSYIKYPDARRPEGITVSVMTQKTESPRLDESAAGYLSVSGVRLVHKIVGRGSFEEARLDACALTVVTHHDATSVAADAYILSCLPGMDQSVNEARMGGIGRDMERGKG